MTSNSSSFGENWICTHCGFAHSERPFSMDGQFQCQGCSQWFSPSGTAPPPIEQSLELLDDHELFQSLDLSDIDSVSGNEKRSLDDRPARAGQMASVRCRVCDTLQYVDVKPSSPPKCDICFAPFPLNPDGTLVQTKGKAQWTSPSGQAIVRDISAEAVGGLGGKSVGSNDEIDDLIKVVRAEVQADFETNQNSEVERAKTASQPTRDDEDELTLQPLPDSGYSGREHLYLEEATRSLLFDDQDAPVDVDGDALVPFEESSQPEPLEAVLDEDEALGNDASEEDLFVALKDVDLEQLPETADGPIDWNSLEPMPLELVEPEPVSKPATVNRPNGGSPTAGTGTGKTPPQFTLPPVAPIHPPTGTAGPASADSQRAAGTRGSQIPIAFPGVRADAVSWDVWKELAMPFTSPWLIGIGIALMPLIYWAQLSWRLAIDDGTTLQKLVGYLSVLFSSAIVLPVWSAFLGVIANRATSVGQAGRLTSQAIFSQGCQFAIVLGCWVPGAALGTVSMHYLVIGCLGAVTMLLGGLYLVTSAIVANELFSYHHPLVWRSLKEQAADWAVASAFVGLLLMTGIMLAVATSYAETVGGILFAAFVVPASMAYAGTIGCLAKRVLQLEDTEPKARKW